MHCRKSLLFFSNETWKNYFGLYWDDGLTLLRILNGILDIQRNLKEVYFLDVTVNLQNGTYCPYKKPKDKLLHIHSLSNHSPQIIKQFPNSIPERLSKNSSNQEIFNTAKVEYKDALKESDYNIDLKQTNNKSEKLKTQK